MMSHLDWQSLRNHGPEPLSQSVLFFGLGLITAACLLISAVLHTKFMITSKYRGTYEQRDGNGGKFPTWLRAEQVGV